MNTTSDTSNLTRTQNIDGTRGTYDIRVVGPDRYLRLTVRDAGLAKQIKTMKALRSRQNVEVRARIDLSIAKFDLISGKYWAKYDPARVTNKSAEIIQDVRSPESFGVRSLIEAMEKPIGVPTAITGTLDGSSLSAGNGLVARMAFAGLPTGTGTKIPYNVKLDAEGRVAAIAWEMPAVPDSPAGEWTMTFRYGSPETSTKPSAKELRPVTDIVYTQLNT